jgi:hypothetical protein
LIAFSSTKTFRNIEKWLKEKRRRLYAKWARFAAQNGVKKFGGEVNASSIIVRQRGTNSPRCERWDGKDHTLFL